MATIALGVGVAGCSQQPLASADTAAVAGPARSNEDARIADLLSQMSLERKVAQLIQPQINSFTAQDMERYRFGSYLNGGNGGPYGDEFAPASQWLKLADEMWAASTKPLPDGEPAIPTMWGTDAVHGHTNVIGATIFPHNIALGATADADLVRRIGAATAVEIEVTGIDWNFSPTVAVARDDRWGRTYESYSENPQLVSTLGAALVEGLQGTPGSGDFLGDNRVISTAKHFFADGGTSQGIDTGDAEGDVEAIKAIHAVPYPVAIDAGVQVIMASFSSINGRKMHGHKEMLTDYLRGDLGFEGLVVGDWNGYAGVDGCTIVDCPQSLLAGLDMYMVPDDWKALLENLVGQVEDGTIPMERLDQAVGNILRVKARAGLLDAPRPSQRSNAGDWAKLGSPEHRAIAREAVAKSQVILKNNGVLPLKPGANVLVAGSAADDIAKAAGGWTLTWQGGGDLDNSYFPGATSIWAGLENAIEAEGGNATLSADGSYVAKPDVAIVVFGEDPYAEFVGDKKDLILRDEEGLDLLRKFDAQGIPTVAVLLSGRTLWMNRELNAADAFVASWLPGGEGAGVADVLTGAREASGRLSFSWPIACSGTPVNGPEGALFEVGYGRSLSDTRTLAQLDEQCASLEMVDTSVLYERGRLGPSVLALALRRADRPGDPVTLTQFLGSVPDTGISVKGLDRNAQEDAREVSMEPNSAFEIATTEADTRAFRIVYRVPDRPSAPIRMWTSDREVEAASVDITQNLSIAAGKDWREMVVTQSCAPGKATNIGFYSEGSFTMQIAEITRVDLPADAECSF